MATNYEFFTNEELSKLIKKLQTELQRRENPEKAQRWVELRTVLHNWFHDYGDIDINCGDFYLRDDDDYSSFGEIYLNGD